MSLPPSPLWGGWGGDTAGRGRCRVITSLLAAGVVDRLIVGVAPTIIGQGTEAVGPLGITSVADGLKLVNRSLHVVGDDVLVSGDLVSPPEWSHKP